MKKPTGKPTRNRTMKPKTRSPSDASVLPSKNTRRRPMMNPTKPTAAPGMFPLQTLISYSCYEFSDNILIILFLSVASTVINDDFVTIEMGRSVLILVLLNDVAALPLPNPLMVVSARPLENGGTCTVGPNGGSV